MTGLAARLLRHRAGPAVATLLALIVGVLILVAMGTLVESGLRFRPEPRLWAAADVVVANRTVSHTFSEFDGETTTSTVTLPEGGTVDAALVDRIRRVPGVAAVAGDERVVIGSPAAVGHGWGTYAFTGRPDRRGCRATGRRRGAGRHPARRGTRRPHRPGRRRGRPSRTG